MLRTAESSEDSEDEERMNMPGLDTVTNAISSTVTKGKMKLWLAKGEDADDALKLFNLDNGIEKLRDATNFNTYASYVRQYNAQNPDHEVSMLAAIAARYGDDEAAKLLHTMTRHASTQAVATKLSQEQVDLWMAAKKTPKEVFALLKLNQNVDDLLSSPALYSMDDFLNAYNRQHKNQHTSLMKVVLGSYDNAKVAKALQDGLESASTKSRAWELKERQFDDWIKAGIKPKEN
ncbi:hypothetical protein DVH05_021483 [Phytophthora capsici]|nr:hypothetical protein DVH05_021483 [Phytophthora capsici]